MPRYKLTLEYDGRPYNGWQKQPDLPSVQEAIETALARFAGQHIDVNGAGRTDAGVHATAQVAHIDLPKEYDAFSVMQGINYYLFNNVSEEEGVPHGKDNDNRIAILHAERVADDFEARFSAVRRRYLYRIINRRARLGLEGGRAWHVVEPLDEKLMQQAANLLLGQHDFTSFRDTQCQAKSPVKTLDTLQISRHGSEIHIATSARSFLHHQVRIMVGTLAQVGKGRWSVDDVRTALEAKNRAAGGPTSPPDGLYLVAVEY